jgi:RNA polymerase sigma-70 factor (ECF subfamily)
MAMRRSDRAPGVPGGDEAFGAEVLGLLKPLYATALRLTRSRPDAEDLVQDTVVKALRFSDRFVSGTNLKAWLFTILHNTWRNTRRSAGRDPVEVDSDLVELADVRGSGAAPGETPKAILLRSTLGADLQAALDGLPDAFREAVWLRDVDEGGRRHARRADWDGDVTDFTRAPPAVRHVVGAGRRGPGGRGR